MPEQGRRIIGLFASIVGARALASLVQAFLLVYLARDLGPLGFGFLAVALTVGGVAGVVTGLGATSWALILGSGETQRATASTLAVLRLASASLVAAATSVLAYEMGLDAVPSLAAGAWIWLDLNSEVVTAIALGQERIGRATSVVLLRRLVPGAAILWALVTGMDVWTALVVGLFVASLATAASLLGLVGSLAPARTVLVGSRPYWLSNCLVALQNAEVAVVGALSPSFVAVGHYAAANRLSSPLQLLTQSILSVATPRMAKIEPSDRWVYFKRVRRWFIIVALLMVAASPFMWWAGPAILGASYAGSGAYFAGVTVAVGLSVMAQCYAAYLYAAEMAPMLSRVRLWSVPAGIATLALCAYSGSTTLLAGAPVLLQAIQFWAIRRRVLQAPTHEALRC